MGGLKEQGDKVVDRYIDVYVYHPCKCFWACCVFQFVLAVVSIAAGSMVPERKEGAWLVYQNPNTQYYKAWENMEQKVDDQQFNHHHNENQNQNQNQNQGGRLLKAFDSAAHARHVTRSPRRLEEGQCQGDCGETARVQLFYKTNLDGTGNIFTPDNIAAMCNLELIALKSSYGTFDNMQSPLQAFYGDAYATWTCDPPAQSLIDTKLNEIKASIAASGAEAPAAGFVHPSISTVGMSAYTRSTISKRMSEDDATKWQEEILNELELSYGFMRSAYQGDADRFVEYKSMRVRMVPSNLDEMWMIFIDFGMAFGAFIIVFSVMYLYMRSCWLASWGMYQIIFALPIGALFYAQLFQVKYFEFLHILIVYLILGIGADDIFVLVDSFKHIAEEFPLKGDGSYSEKDLHTVLKKTFYRAASAILNTSFTTSVAFLSGAVSKVMPMRTCGIYAATCIIACYVLTISFTPATLVIYHTRFQGKRTCCPSAAKRPEATMEEDNNSARNSVMMKGEEDKEASTLGPVDRFMIKFYIPLMSKKVGSVRIFSLIGVLIMLGVAIQGLVFTARLTPPTKAEAWVPDNHMQVDLNQFMSDNYLSPDYEEFAKITVFWGVDRLNIDQLDPYNPQDFKDGVEYDSAFDPSSQAAQDHIKYVCEQLRTVQCTLEGCKSRPYGTLMMKAANKTHACFIEDFMDTRGAAGAVTGTAFTNALLDFRNQGDSGRYSSNMINADYRRMIGVIGGQLRYLAVEIRSTLPREEPYKTGIDVRKLVDDYVNQWKAQAPDSMKSIKYIAEGAFAEYDLGSELIHGLFQGCAISLPIAFLVLLASTRNIIASLYAVMCVAFIVTSVLGFCKSAMDWDLGIGEAIAGVIVIGYSVDYVVHLAHIYCEAVHYGYESRDDRCQFAIKSLGTTVFAGAVTTAGSGAIMFVCFFYFFFKMALLITTTIMYSFLYAFILFMGLMWLIGPEGSCGDLGCPKLFQKQIETE